MNRGADGLSDCTYAKNEFIFSWLKSLAVQSAKQAEPSLQQLFSWYNSTRLKEEGFFVKKEKGNKAHLEEW